MKYQKKIKKMLEKLKTLLKPIYKNLLNGYPINYFNKYSQYVYFQINIIYCYMNANKSTDISFACEIKNLFNDIVKLYTIYIDCGCNYLFLDDNFSIQRLPLINCENECKIKYLSESLNKYNQIISLIDNLIFCVCKNK
jgi:hypothetical protein